MSYEQPYGLAEREGRARHEAKRNIERVIDTATPGLSVNLSLLDRAGDRLNTSHQDVRMILEGAGLLAIDGTGNPTLESFMGDVAYVIELIQVMYED